MKMFWGLKFSGFANENALGLENFFGFANENVLLFTNENVFGLEISWGLLILGFPNCSPIFCVILFSFIFSAETRSKSCPNINLEIRLFYKSCPNYTNSVLEWDRF